MRKGEGLEKGVPRLFGEAEEGGTVFRTGCAVRAPACTGRESVRIVRQRERGGALLPGNGVAVAGKAGVSGRRAGSTGGRG